MAELVINLHMHTCYSDGTGTHKQLALSALKTGVDVLLVTDHNVLVNNVDEYFTSGGKKVLLIAGEEIHDQNLTPQHNHLLVFGVKNELAILAGNTQALIDTINESKGISFIAHPVEKAMPAFGESEISWINWNIKGFTGLEIWNGFSELKSISRGKLDAIVYAFFPELIPHHPEPDTLHIWDELLNNGQRVVAVGGSDAHALYIPLGPFRKTIFPYVYHFSAINTHILTPHPLTGEIEIDKEMIYSALSSGNCFVGNELPFPTYGFRFSAQSRNKQIIMGEEMSIDEPVTLQCNLPSIGEIRLLKNGQCVKEIIGESLVFSTGEPGVYRIEGYKKYLGKLRGWIFSNPIYLR